MNLDKVLIDWSRDEGDKNRLLDYPLVDSSLVFEVGGYEGAWALKIAQKYNSIVHLFEPVKRFYEVSVERLRNNPKVSCFNFGLSDHNSLTEFVVKADGSCSGEGELVELRDVVEIIKSPIDLISINIEGGEYRLLPRMLDTGIVNLCQHLQIQFHNYPNCIKLRDDIRRKLMLTHTEIFNYPFVWESWRINA